MVVGIILPRILYPPAPRDSQSYLCHVIHVHVAQHVDKGCSSRPPLHALYVLMGNKRCLRKKGREGGREIGLKIHN